MRNLLLATLLVLGSGCGSSADSKATAPNEVPMCQTADGGVCSGVPGAQGEKGDTGAQGAKGDPGLQGVQGPQGLQGPKGDQGLQGPQGAQGSQGFPGTQGPQGPQGANGAPGAQGSQGPQGTQGPAGAQGAQGVQGPAGPAGPSGSALWFETNVYDGAAMTIVGQVTTVFSGMGVYATEAQGSTGISNFPEGFTFGTKATTFYYNGCGGSDGPYVAAADHIMKHQLVWTSTATTTLYQTSPNGTATTITPCGGTAMVAMPLTLTSYKFNPTIYNTWDTISK
jgi:hypothetical protein